MEYLKSLLVSIGFTLKEGRRGIWEKKYEKHHDYEIEVSLGEILGTSKINWGDKIRAERKSTSNFSQSETLVVLECVDRLLEKGYRPENLILEKEWKLGHKGKGFLDIQVLDEEGKSFLMVECKTHGKEYEKAKKDTEKDGAQLFGYFIQERNTKYLCLYASLLEENEIKVFSDTIVVNKEIRSAENSQEAFEAWLPQVWETRGIFGEDDRPYNVEFKGILKKELRSLTKEDGGNIYNKFAEILRKNVVSDKTNAFNKIFNLFLCKIVDEFETEEASELRFQWKEGEKNEDVLLRLNDLYKRGMELYLDLKIEAVSEEELKKELERSENKESIKQLFIRQKLYSGNEFAFKEIFDKKTFDENSIVVKEVVKLLEQYRIKYSTKQQFLGDFFENLLNAGIKQESGQFFTPIPIAQFICKSIPIEQIIQEKNSKAEPYFLPYVIDYASGSGHFLTEAMEEIDNHIKNIEESWIKCGAKHKKEFFKNRDNFDWASEYIYGIEKDYRLAKTTKISTFLNGDGDANIFCADGLDHFQKSTEYKGKLTKLVEEKDNQQFDVLIANPPYSVDGFKNTLKHGKETFELCPYLTDKSSEIECLFIERTKQLLREGGVAGIILPISILSNGKIHLRAREILLKYFEIKGIVEFGSNTFMATGTKTATLFLRRRANSEWKVIESLINDFFVNFQDVAINRIENAFSHYTKHVFEGIELKDYVSLFGSNPSEKILKHELIKEYKALFKKLRGEKLIEAIREAEKEKLLYFLLTYNQDVVLVKAPSDNSEEKEFLGYEFSTRRGHEGIKIYKDAEEKNLTKLYNAEPEQLHDKNKVNSYILRAFEGKSILEPTEELKGVLQVQKLHESIDFDRVNFEKRIATEFRKKKVKIESKWDLVTIKNILLPIQSKIEKIKKSDYLKEGKTPIVSQENELVSGYTNLNIEPIQGDDLPLVVFGDHSLCVKYIDFPFAFGADGVKLLKPKKEVNPKYFYYFLRNLEIESKGYSRHFGILKEIKIPLPPLDVQEKIVREMEAIEMREKEIVGEGEQLEKSIENLISDLYQNTKEKVLLGDVCEKITDGFHNTPSLVQEGIPMLDVVDMDNFEIKNSKPKKFISEETYQQLAKRCDPSEDDILVSSRGTIGKIAFVQKGQKFGMMGNMILIRPMGEKLAYKYLGLYLHAINKTIEQIAHGTSQKGLYLNKVKSLKIPLPPLFEQEKIVEQIEQIETKQAELGKELEEAKAKKGEVLKKYL